MNDTRLLLEYDANKKSAGLAYALWLLLGWLGAHRFYAGKPLSALLLMAGMLGSWLLTFVFLGYLTMQPFLLWWLIDVFLVGGWIRDHNTRLIQRLSN
jgi:TM2 domain-containing membrane protein YozV